MSNDKDQETPVTEDRAASRAAAKASKAAEKDAAKAAADAEKAAKIEELRTAKASKAAEKDAAKAAKRSAKQATKSAPATDSSAPIPRTTSEKIEKDPYRPRFAVAPGSVRVFTVVAYLAALFAFAGAAFAGAVATGAVVVDELGSAPDLLVWALAAISLVSGTLWALAGSLLAAGRRGGIYLGWVAVLVPSTALPLAIIAAISLFARDSRDWAI